MLKPLAIGLLSITAAGAAFAHGQPNPNFYMQSWTQSFSFNQQYGNDVFGDGWKQVVNDPQLPVQFKNLCQSNPQQCNVWVNWAQSVGIWLNSGKHQHPLPAPEVDPAGALAALTILAAVLAMVRGRRPAGKPA